MALVVVPPETGGAPDPRERGTGASAMPAEPRAGTRVHLLPDPSDEMAGFARSLSALRWSALCMALLLTAVERRGVHSAIGASVLVAYTAWRTLRPVDFRRGGLSVGGPLLFEVVLCVAAVEFTHLSASPFLVSLAAATLAAGFAGGFRLVPGMAVLAAVSVPVSMLIGIPRQTFGGGLQFAVELLLVGLLGGYCRYLVDDARHPETGLALRVDDLVEVNQLLSDLHGATARVATPLDLASAVEWVIERVEHLFAPDSVAVLLYDADSDRWTMAGSSGLSVHPDTAVELPEALWQAALSNDPVVVGEPGRGLAYQARAGQYCALRARDRLIGLLAVEFRSPRPFTAADVRRTAELAAAAGLAIDSARWLKRLHTLGVEQERARLARELHDHIGQSVVYLGFEIDRITDMNAGRAVQKDLLALRDDLRTVVTELRDALVDLRSDVSEERDLPSVLGPFVERINRRGELAVEFTQASDRRLPVAVEREFWRVAQEAVANAVKHSRGSKVVVVWHCDGHGAVLEVHDDGAGLPAGAIRRSTPGFGMVGMRERADAVGATLEIESEPGRGTTVRMSKHAGGHA